jgi:hypothetical protein
MVCCVIGSSSSLFVYPVHYIMSVTAIVVNIILDGHNYSEWAFYVQTALQGNGLLFHLTDDPPALLTDHRYQNMADQWWQGDGCYGQ